MARLSLSVLGPFQAALDGEPIARFESDKVRALLAYLAVEADRPHRRERLAGLLWPDRPDQVALSNLRSVLSNLRLAIADRRAQPPYLLVSRDTIQFNVASDCFVDVRAFTELVAPGRAGQPDDGRFQQAVALYRGRFLEGLSLDECADFE